MKQSAQHRSPLTLECYGYLIIRLPDETTATDVFTNKDSHDGRTVIAVSFSCVGECSTAGGCRRVCWTGTTRLELEDAEVIPCFVCHFFGCPSRFHYDFDFAIRNFLKTLGGILCA